MSGIHPRRPRRPKYLRGYGGGGRIHAIPVKDSDPRPLGHGRRPQRTLCGIVVASGHTTWTPTLKLACQRCANIAENEGD